MANKDYKHRVPGNGHAKKMISSPNNSKSDRGLFRSMRLSAAIIAAVALVLIVINQQSKKHSVLSTSVDNGRLVAKSVDTSKNNPQEPLVLEPTGPQFDFYTILPERDVIVPEYEIKTRAREEAIGKESTKRYIMQAGSFKTALEAQQLSTRLATMGIETSLQKAKVGNMIWYRVKLGPYTQMSSISTLRTRLRQNGIDVVVTEIEN